MSQYFLGDLEDDLNGNSEQLSSSFGTNNTRKEGFSKFLDHKAELGKFRSSSAPPTVVEEALAAPNVDSEEFDEFRADPAYVQYYYNQRLLNPRLPRPLVLTNTWKTSTKNEDENSVQKKKDNTLSSYADVAKQKSAVQTAQQQQQVQKSTTVVDRIQKDFPRTPSPVYTLQNGTAPVTVLQKTNTLAVPQPQQPKLAVPQPTRPKAVAPSQKPTPMFFPDIPDAENDTTTHDLADHMQNMNFVDNTDQYLKPPTAQHQQPQHQQQPRPFQPMPLQQPDMMGYFNYGYPTYPPQMYPFMQTAQISPVLMNYPSQVKDQNQRKMFFNQPVQPISQPAYEAPNDYYTTPVTQSAWDNPSPAVVAPQPVAQQAAQQSVVSPPPKERRRQKNNGQTTKQSMQTVQAPAPSADDDNGPRSKVMEEFKSGKNRRFELKDIVGHVKEFSRDQYGSRFIQQKLETATNKEKELIFSELFPYALELMTDVFGNYVIQKFFEHGTPEQKKNLAKILKGHVLALTLQTYGCRVIQKALELIEDDDKAIIAEELNGHVMRCVQDQNGNHVIQKCIEKVPSKHVQFIVDAFANNVASQAVHAYGCRVIQRMLEHCNDKQSKTILDELLIALPKLVKDQYGNYVVQHVLERGHLKHKLAIVRATKNQITIMSQNKFASNVVEKCFQFGGKKERQDILDEILAKSKDPNNSNLITMMKDQYANYVVQKIIEMADDQQRKQIYEAVKPLLPIIRRLTFAKHIMACIEKYLGSSSDKLN